MFRFELPLRLIYYIQIKNTLDSVNNALKVISLSGSSNLSAYAKIVDWKRAIKTVPKKFVSGIDVYAQ